VYRVEGALALRASGVVLRGEGAGENGSVILATGKKQRTLIEVGAPRVSRTETPGTRRRVTDAYVPWSAKAFSIESADGLKVGEQRNGVLRVNGSWMNLDGFFYRRSIPEAMPRMMAWFQDLVAKRDPRERPNNFMKD
jgi:hypothetical protein